MMKPADAVSNSEFSVSYTAEPTTPTALLEDFDWERVETRDQVLRWTGTGLRVIGPDPGTPAAEG